MQSKFTRMKIEPYSVKLHLVLLLVINYWSEENGWLAIAKSDKMDREVTAPMKRRNLSFILFLISIARNVFIPPLWYYYDLANLILPPTEDKLTAVNEEKWNIAFMVITVKTF